jgi:WD40 repeat protein
VIKLNNGLIASGSQDESVCIWNPNNGSRMLCLQNHKDIVRVLAVSFDGKLISGSRENRVLVWE